MEANELRIGNYVQTNDKRLGNNVRPFGIYPVFEIGSNHVSCYHSKDNEHGGFYKLEDLKPIPLTEELLLKSGFYKAEYLEHIFNINIDGLYFAFDEAFEGGKDENIVGDFDECVTIRIPKYLHQLQNLYFALTGKELEINL